MKEATGELNGSIIVMTAVALLAAFFFMVVWPNIKNTLNNQAKCADAVCEAGFDKDGMATCHTPKDTGKTFSCPYRG